MTDSRHKPSLSEYQHNYTQVELESLCKEAVNYHIRGDLKNAEKTYRKAIEAGSTKHMIFLNLGVICKNSGRTDEAILLYQKAIQISPDSPDAYNNLGNLYIGIGDFTQALNPILKSIQLAPNDPDVLTTLGWVYKKLGKSDQALSSTIKSLELNPDNPNAYLNLGSIYKDLGQLDQALVSTLKSLKLNPDNHIAYMNLGGTFRDLGKLNKALTSTLKAIELKPDNPDALINLGGIYKDLGNLDKALSSTLKAIELKPENPTAYMNLGGIYKELGNIDQAIAATQKSLKLMPDKQDAHLNLGMIYEANNEIELALQHYVKSANLSEKNKEGINLTSLISSVIILLQLNRIEKASLILKNAMIATASINSQKAKKDSVKNSQHNSSYLTYLSALIPKIPIVNSKNECQILHLGESHCLTFTNQLIRIKGKDFRITPCLIKGAKAFHLGNRSKNIYKVSFDRRVKTDLETYNYIFLSFGEIDCRPDEGIIDYCQKNGQPIKPIAQITAERYFEWTMKYLSEYANKLVYFGTPSPPLIEEEKGIPTDESQARLLAIKTFNISLQEQCRKSNILFADVFNLTRGKDGYNNGLWMLDGVHLSPKALNKLILNL